MTKTIAVGIGLALLVPTLGWTQVRVDGYIRRDGTYVQPHYRSAPDSTPSNNWSTRGNLNPYTGQYGTRNPSSLPPMTPSYLPRRSYR